MRKRFDIGVLILIFLIFITGCSGGQGNTVSPNGTSDSTVSGTLKEITGSQSSKSNVSSLKEENKEKDKEKDKEKESKKSDENISLKTSKKDDKSKNTAPLTSANKTNAEVKENKKDKKPQGGTLVKEDGKYTSKEEVAEYINKFGKLPSNYITKKEAMARGWKSSLGNLWEVTDKMSIGGDVFGNFEKLLPVVKGMKYFECDIDYNGGKRNAKRIIYSDRGDIYYTDDHYKTFEKLK